MDRDPLKHEFEEEQSVNLIPALGPIYLPRMGHCRHCGEHRDAHAVAGPLLTIGERDKEEDAADA